MRNLAFALYALVCLAAITWPGLGWLNARAPALVLGVPTSHARNVAW